MVKTKIWNKTTGLLVAFVLTVAGLCAVPLVASAAGDDSAEPVVYSEELDTVAVKVTAPADAFSEKVDLVVKQLGEDENEFSEAEKALADNKQTYDGILAFDIHFENAAGEEVEPNGAVSVEMTAKKAAFEGVDPEAVASVQITHIGDETAVVADSADTEVEGTVEVQATEEAVEKVDAAFEVDSFSTYALTWDDGAKSATIHWGTLTDDGFVEFDSTTTVDETAASVDLAVNIDGYYFTGATYKEDASSDEAAMETSVVKKNDDGVWTVDTITYDGDDNPIKATVAIADGSDIYVYYAEKGGGGYNPPAPAPATLDNIKPETDKTVTSNGDGTYNIRLDVTGHATEDEKQGANVIVMLDMTYSMRQNDMNGTRIAAAKQALLTLIDALNPGYDAQHPELNLVNFTLATFGNTMNTSTELSWTQSRSAMESAVRGLSNSPGAMGTNWQGGLGGAETLAEAANSNPDLKKNPTYVIFVTDGAPNCWQGHTSSSTGNDLDPAALPYAQTAANSLTQDAILYGVFCGPASGYNNLANMVTAANGAGTINGSSTTDLQDAFSQIAGHIVAGMAAGNVTVDDGIPSLSNVSANVTAGEAGAFTYYIKPEGEPEAKEWVKGATSETDPGAPGATYDKSNGVTWDLGEVGTLQDGWVYSIEFTVWPSQEAYDTIADLNNGLITMTDEELEAAGIGKNSDGTYYLLTNTHLNTTFTDPTGKVYDVEDSVVTEAMALPTETISVQKVWNNFLDQQNPPPGMRLILTKDEANYLSGENAIEVSAATNWKADDIYISNGQIRTTDEGYEILETGHDYEIVEPEEEAEGGYRWELTSQIYHPMVIDGTDIMLIRNDDATGIDGTDYYMLGGHKYVEASTGANTLQAWNDRRSWLQIEKKVTGEDVPEGALFEFTATIEDANGEDVWFSAYGPGGIVKDLETNATPEAGDTGYYYIESGSPLTVKIEAGWTLRFLNLPSGTTYTIDETGLPDGFAFDEAEGRTVVDTAAQQDAPLEPTIEDSTASGTINVPNVEFYVDYTNKYEEIDIEFTKEWVDGNDQDGIRPDAEEFADYLSLLVNGDASTAYDENRAITDNEDGTYTISYEGVPKYIDGEEAVYKLQESKIEGYETSGSPADVKGTITNTHKPVTVSVSLEATKAIADGSTWPSGKTLTFTLAGDDAPLPETTTAALSEPGTVSFGPIVYSVAAGDAGKEYTYTITEDGFGGGWTGSPDEITATVKVENTDDGLTASVTYSPEDKTITNTYDATGSVKLEATKALEGAEWPEGGSVTFTLSGEGGTLPETKAITLTEAGTATFDAITYGLSDAGKTYTYAITETAGFGDGWTGSPEKITATVTVGADTGTGTLGTTVTYTPEDKTITNTYDATGSVKLEATKALEGAEWPEGGSVTFTLSGEGGTLPETKAITLTEAGTATFDAITYGLSDAGKTYTYAITETAGFGDGWTPSGAVSVSVEVTDNGDGTLTATPTYTPEDKTITNTYDATGSVKLEATKALEGAEWPEGGSVTFTLSGEGGTLPETKAITLTEAGTATFDAITYGLSDAGKTYTYAITETAGFGDGWTPSGAVSVSVEVTDNGDGTLTATPTYTPEDKTITNTYDATGSVKLEATKALEGAEWPEGGSVTFTLSGEGGTLPETKAITLTEAGTATFDAITYGLSDAGKTYTYAITETAGFGDGWTPSGAVSVSVEVTDNGDGTLTATPTYTPEDKTITNTYDATGSVKLEATKALEGAEWPEGGSVTFTLSGEGGTLPETKAITLTEAGTATFDAITYGLSDAGKTYTYAITETAGFGDGWTPSGAVSVSVEVTDNGDGTLTATPTYTPEDKTITNTYDATGSVKLEATKALEGAEWPEGGSVTFTLSGEGGTLPETKAITLTEAGTATFDAITYGLSDAGKTYTYAITETAGFGDGWTPSGAVSVSVEVTDNGDGTLTATPTYTPEDKTITNTYDATGSVKLEATKALEGAEWPEGGSVTFTLSGEGGTLPETKAITLTEAGTATFDAITYGLSDAGKTYTYAITETAGFGDGWTPSGAVSVSVEVTDNGDGTLTATPTYTPEDKTITNTYDATGSVKLEATKALEGAEWPEGGSVTFTLSGEGGTLPETKAITLTEAGTATFDAITYGLSDAGKTYTYAITETAGFGDGWTPSGAVSVSVEVTDNGDGTLTATPTYTPEDKTITNTYKAEGSVSFPAKKVLEIPEGAAGPTEASWTFTLTADEGVPMPTTTTYTVGAGDTVTFGEIAYDESDAGKTYTYTVTETGTVAGVDNDPQSAKTVTVEVKDNGDGTLTATADSTAEDPLTFTNTYKVAELEYELLAAKVLEVEKPAYNPPDVSGKYKLAIQGSTAGTPMPENTEIVNPDGAGTAASFGKIKYAAPGEYQYTVTETGEVDGVTNGQESYTVKVKVEDNHDGTMTASVVEGSKTTVFTNIYKVKPVTLPTEDQFTVYKELKGTPLTGGAFEFQLTAGENTAGEGVETPMPEEATATNDDDGKVVFGAVTYDVPGTYNYTITEIDGKKQGYSYDLNRTVGVKVTVTDNGKGELEAKVTYEGGTTFVNEYTAEGQWDPSVSKKLNGRTLEEGQFSFELVDENGKVLQTKANDASGSVDFDPIEYTQDIFDADTSGKKAAEKKAADPAEPEAAAEAVEPEAAADELAAEPEAAADELAAELEAADAQEAASEPAGDGFFPQAYADEFDDTSSTEFAAEVGDVADEAAPAAEVKAAGDEAEAAEGRTKTFTYTIREVNDGKPGYSYDGHEVTVTVTVTDKGDGELEVTESYDGSTTFVNTYKAEGKVDLFAAKEVTGTDLLAGQFSFELKDGNEVLQTVSNDEDGVVTFDPVKYTEADAGKTYNYTITEVNDGKTGYTYDSHVCDVTIKVFDNGNGTLFVTATYSDGDVASFTNPYKPLATSAPIKAAKSLEGRDQKAGEFSFELADKDGKVVRTATNAADGTVDFGNVEFDEAGTYTFTAKEVKGSDSTITYDESVKTYTVEVADEGGQLVAKVSCDSGDTATFTNKYTPNTPPSMPITGDNLPVMVLVAIAIAAAAVCAVAARRRALAIKAERRANHGYYGGKR